jgi:DNA-binding CsgD family transcriptional regulator
MIRIDRTNPKGDRALQLAEQGIAPAAIAERLGIRPSNVYELIKDAKLRRDRKVKEAAE